MTAPLDRQLHFVTGKGGVGKSVVSCALASRFCGEGRNTLLVQVNAADSHAPLLGIDPIGDEVRSVDGNLSVVNLSPAQSLREYALLTLKFEAVYKAAFENRLMKNFLRFIPSLPELTMLGKIWFHSEERVSGRPRFERVVVDCPSTGHGLGFLRVAQVIHDVIRFGKIADEAQQMNETLHDPARTAVHVVSLPEEMPTNEAIHLVNRLRDDFPLGLLVLNQWLDPLFHEDDEQAFQEHEKNADPLLAPFEAAGRRRQLRDRLSQHERARLKEHIDLPLVLFPLVTKAQLTRIDVAAFAECLPC